jgi:peptidoglycan/LPS O-acetylase OafA/YrhL
VRKIIFQVKNTLGIVKTYITNLSVKDILYPVAPSSGEGIMSECEALRGWAITLVFLFHFLGSIYGYKSNSNYPYWLSFLLSGNMGLTLFFVLSGFLLSRPFINQRSSAIKVFFWNRFLRIMPLYTLFVIMGVLANSNIQQGLRAICFWDLRLNQLWPFGAVWWSLGVEIQFYLVLPFIMYFVFSKKVPSLIKGLILSTLAVIAVVLYWKALNALKAICIDTHFQQATNTFFDLQSNLAVRWPNFLLGILLAYIQKEYGNMVKRFSYIKNKKGILGDFLLLASCSAIVIFGAELSRRYGTAPANADIYFLNHYLIEGVLFFVLMFVLMNFKSNLRVIIVNPVFNVLGVISYSIYLCHVPVLNATVIKLMMKNPVITNGITKELLMTSAACAVLTFVISIITYTFFEKIFLLFKMKNMGRKSLLLCINPEISL